MTLAIIQIFLALALITLILLQERSAGMSGIFGGDGGGGFYQTRRGLERMALWSTVVLGVIFVGVSVAQLLLR